MVQHLALSSHLTLLTSLSGTGFSLCAFAFVGAGLIPARRREAPSLRSLELPRLHLRQGMASVHPEERRAVPKRPKTSGVLTPEVGTILLKEIAFA